MVSKIELMKWAIDPENWIYFKTHRVGQMTRKAKRGYGENYDFGFWEEASRLISKAREGWKDEWLTVGQVTLILNIHPKATPRRKGWDRLPGVRYVNKAIHAGNLRAKKWQNWMIKRSDLPAKGQTINFKGEFTTKKKERSR